MNNHLYSLDYVLLTLRLVIKHLDFKEEDIFRYGSDRDQPPLQAVKDYISLILNKQKSEDSLPQFIFDFNHDPENIQKKLEISHNTLSKLSQEVIINGCLLDRNNINVVTAWTLLCNELYIPWMLLDKSGALSNIIQAKSKTFSTFVEENNFLRIFNEFMNTLCALGYQQTVEAFHQYLYITYNVTLYNENNQTTPEGIAKIQSICLTNGLELEGVLSKIDPSNNSPHYSALLKQENILFYEMVHYLANCDQFKKPFSLTDYNPALSIQFNTTFEKITASIWGKPNIAIIPYSNDIFGACTKSNFDPALLPIIVDDTSENATNDLRTRSQSPRAAILPEKHERSKKSFELFRKKVAKSDEPIKTRKISSEGISHSIDKDRRGNPIKTYAEQTAHSSGKNRKYEPTKKEKLPLSHSTPNLEPKISPNAIIDNDKKNTPKRGRPILTCSNPESEKEPYSRPKRESKSFSPSRNAFPQSEELKLSSPRSTAQEPKLVTESKKKSVLPLLVLSSSNAENDPLKSPIKKSPKNLGSPKMSVLDIFIDSNPKESTSSSSCSYTSETSSEDYESIHSVSVNSSLVSKQDEINELAEMLQNLRFKMEPNNGMSASETTEDYDYFHHAKKEHKEKRGPSASPRNNEHNRSEYVPLLHQYTSSKQPARSKSALKRTTSNSKLNNKQIQSSSQK